jgi:uncharacterized spore protein YtfJ
VSMERMFAAVENLRRTASADLVFGEAEEVGGRVLVPIAEVSAGFGMGFGQGSSEGGEAADAEGGSAGGGGGGKAKSRPVAVVEITQEGTVLRPIVDETKIALAGILLVGWIVFWLTATVRAGLRSRKQR